MEQILDSIYQSGIAVFIRESDKAFPMLESIHVVSICLVVAFIFWVDFRLAWLGYRDLGIAAVQRIALPIVWCAFAGAVVTGALMFSSIAPDYAGNPVFIAKMGAIGLAGANMAAYHGALHFRIFSLDDQGAPPIAARLFALVSITLWVTVVSLGRYIGFST